MLDNVTQKLSGYSSETDASAIRPLFEALADRLSSQTTASGALATASLTPVTSAALQGFANGVPFTIASGVSMPALSGTIPAGYYGIFAFFSDGTTVTSALGTPGATLAQAKFPTIPKKNAVLGYIIVTSASPFVGGTTTLASATVVYVNTLGAFDPTVLLG